MLNLDSPPGFRGLDLNASLQIYSRNLPHWRQNGATYFVTFNLVDALPIAKRNELEAMRRDWEHRFPPPRDEVTWRDYAKSVFRKVEKWMDTGYGQCWFRQREYANELSRSILHFHESHYDVGCFVVMGNHCHLIVRPLSEFDLENEVGSIKNVTAIFVNKRESLAGALWQQESYDHIIRDEEHLYRIVQYIGANPGQAGIAPDKWHRWINPAWQAFGWDFQT